jgi:hypothetical protein
VETAIEDMGPVDYLVVEFPENRLDGEAFPLLMDLVDRGVVRVLDLAFVAKADDGTVTGIDLRELDATGDFDVTVLEGASSGLLGDDDLAEAAAALAPGAAAGEAGVPGAPAGVAAGVGCSDISAAPRCRWSCRSRARWPPPRRWCPRARASAW